MNIKRLSKTDLILAIYNCIHTEKGFNNIPYTVLSIAFPEVLATLRMTKKEILDILHTLNTVVVPFTLTAQELKLVKYDSGRCSLGASYIESAVRCFLDQIDMGLSSTILDTRPYIDVVESLPAEEHIEVELSLSSFEKLKDVAELIELEVEELLRAITLKFLLEI